MLADGHKFSGYEFDGLWLDYGTREGREIGEATLTALYNPAALDIARANAAKLQALPPTHRHPSP